MKIVFSIAGCCIDSNVTEFAELYLVPIIHETVTANEEIAILPDVLRTPFVKGSRPTSLRRRGKAHFATHG